MMMDPFEPENPDPRCTCIHGAADHDPQTGACLKINPHVGPCPCGATPDDVRDAQWETFRARQSALEVS